ncbi:MAG: hypothetical protein KAQ69_02655 [Spirochaetales bacterium]|nr:hypothetical protein [Spirochaetales bacterium]
MNEEYMRILKMIEEGKISAEEGAELMKAIGGEENLVEEQLAGKKTSLHGKKLRIVVTDIDTGKDKANIKIPLRLAKIAEKMVPRNAKAHMKEQGIDLAGLLSNIDELTDGPLIDIDADDDNEHVRVAIYIE